MKIIGSLIIILSIALIIPLHDTNSNLTISNDFILMLENFSSEYIKETAKFENEIFINYTASNTELAQTLEYFIFTYLSNLINKISMITLVIGLIVLRIEKGLISSILNAFKIKIIALLTIQSLIYLVPLFT
jgi:hypothetical protein